MIRCRLIHRSRLWILNCRMSRPELSYQHCCQQAELKP
jgi:hypothetical protein